MEIYNTQIENTICWFKNKKLHRLDGPAIEYANGDKAWYLNGKRHRIDGPAIEHANGSKEWYINGKCHREDGPAIEHSDGYKEWWLNDTFVRLENRLEKIVPDTTWIKEGF